MDADGRKLFEDSLRKATETLTGEALDSALDALGWRDALASDPGIAVAELFTLQGVANATSSALDEVLLPALGLSDAGNAAVVLPRLGRSGAPASGGELSGVATRRIATAERLVVVSAVDGTHTAAILPRDAVSQRAISGVDPALGLVAVRGTLPATGTERVPWDTAVAAGQVALAHELVGAATTLLQLARDHAVQRIQFGRSIASFQAVRHRLADCLVAVEAADSAVSVAWLDRSPLAAALAKAIAGRSARTVGRHSQQVLGGMGFTTEHPLHRYVRRTLALDQLLGSSRRLTTQIGAEIGRTRQLPAMLPL